MALQHCTGCSAQVSDRAIARPLRLGLEGQAGVAVRRKQMTRKLRIVGRQAANLAVKECFIDFSRKCHLNEVAGFTVRAGRMCSSVAAL